MYTEMFRRLAQQCRDMMGRARTDVAREQLRIWAEEFDAQAGADADNHEAKDRNPNGDPHR